ncbi:MAG: helix-turn-helix transcriptional regulator [Chitinophagaceae bacterium]
MTRDALVTSKEFWIVDIQTKLYQALENYRVENGLNRTQLAAALGYSKGYISQILNGNFDHRISKLVELALKIGMMPEMQFKPQSVPVKAPSKTKVVVKGVQPIVEVKNNLGKKNKSGKEIGVQTMANR